jgi:hypothetical protein
MRGCSAAAVSFAAVLLTVWVTFGQLGWCGRYRGAAVLGVGAVAMWMEPVLVSPQQGQIKLMLAGPPCPVPGSARRRLASERRTSSRHHADADVHPKQPCGA